MSDFESASPAFAEVKLIVAKNAIGAELEEDFFEFGLFDEAGAKLQTASNSLSGLVKFDSLMFTREGEYNYTIRETFAPEGWEADTNEYPVHIVITMGGPTGLTASVSYPEGTPGFKNTFDGEPCSLIEFPEITFNAPGVYEYFLKELTPSGGGWTTDGKSVKVIVTVIDDGYGNLLATIDYPEGFPKFTNTYTTKPAHIIISATKKAIGASLPCGRFEFGLFDEEDKLIFKTTNKNG